MDIISGKEGKNKKERKILLKTTKEEQEVGESHTRPHPGHYT